MKKFLFFLIFFLPFQFALNPFPGIDLSIARLLIVLAFLIWLILSLLKKEIFFQNNYLTWGLILFLAFCLLSIIKAEELGWALRKILVFVSIFPLYFLISSIFEKKDFSKISKVLLGSTTIISLLGIFQFLSQFLLGKTAVFNFWSKYLARFFLGEAFSRAVVSNPSWLVNISGRTVLRATALFPDPHMFSFFLGMSLPLFIPLILTKKKKKFFLTCFILNLICLVLTFSRGGYLGLISSGLVLVFFLFKYLKKKQKKYVLISTLILVFIVLLISPVRHRLLSSFDLKEGSVSGRLEIWQRASSIWLKNSYLGVGIGNYSFYQNPLNDYRLPVYAHNTYLDIAVETGIFSLIVWLSLFVFLGYSLLKKKGTEKDLWRICLLASLTYFLIHSFFETALYSPRILPLLMLIMGLSSLLIQKEKGTS